MKQVESVLTNEESRSRRGSGVEELMMGSRVDQMPRFIMPCGISEIVGNKVRAQRTANSSREMRRVTQRYLASRNYIRYVFRVRSY